MNTCVILVCILIVSSIIVVCYIDAIIILYVSLLYYTFIYVYMYIIYIFSCLQVQKEFEESGLLYSLDQLQYEEGKVLGEGAFGVVRKAQLQMSDGASVTVAVKSLKGKRYFNGVCSAVILVLSHARLYVLYIYT